MRAEQHFRQQIEERVKQKDDHGKNRDDQNTVAQKPTVNFYERKTQDQKVGQRVADQDGPQKFFRVFKKTLQQFRRGPARARQPPYAQPVQREHARLHAREQKRQQQAQAQKAPVEYVQVHLI